MQIFKVAVMADFAGMAAVERLPRGDRWRILPLRVVRVQIH